LALIHQSDWAKLHVAGTVNRLKVEHQFCF
jgi:hypothetical protein